MVEKKNSGASVRRAVVLSLECPFRAGKLEVHNVSMERSFAEIRSDNIYLILQPFGCDPRLNCEMQ